MEQRKDRMWIDIGPEKEALLRGHGFGIVEMSLGFRRGRTEPLILTFGHVRDTPLMELRAEMRRLAP
jgi:hypothetical protein